MATRVTHQEIVPHPTIEIGPFGSSVANLSRLSQLSGELRGAAGGA